MTLILALKPSRNIRYATTFLDCWNVAYKTLENDREVFLSVDLDGLRREIYDSLLLLVQPFEPIDITELVNKGVVHVSRVS